MGNWFAIDCGHAGRVPLPFPNFRFPIPNSSSKRRGRRFPENICELSEVRRVSALFRVGRSPFPCLGARRNPQGCSGEAVRARLQPQARQRRDAANRAAIRLVPGFRGRA